jgi:hypothetical protein
MIEAGSADTTTSTDRTKSFSDVMCELNIGMKLLIDHLDKVFDAGFELDLEMGGDVMDACIAAQWVAPRLSEEIHTARYEFNGTRSEQFAQAAE